MNKTFCIVIMLAVQSVVFSQVSFGISGGYATNGFGAHASYNYDLNDSGYFQINLLATDNKDKKETLDVPYRTIGLNAAYFYNLFKSYNNRFVTSIGAGASGGYEIINNGNNILENGSVIVGNSSIVYGGVIGSEIKYYLSDTVALLGVHNTNLYVNSDLGVASFYMGLGIKFYIK
ncbi:conjugative transposon protein TraO [Mariniflexile fucanivorans]|uniref:Conjugative transposon protein TraO n=1 Tax=Mariniflexile fucanivorans TaxID=264023 RepID=A0A4R1R9V2_9FLAO|nr:conjugal transfer protein TraO [Mariniflexile fucanivorans]TCL62475.1 conjugative transposon protein TraO [Mariniflexile fucanivorans]